jgi:hypothetical protein
MKQGRVRSPEAIEWTAQIPWVRAQSGDKRDAYARLRRAAAGSMLVRVMLRKVAMVARGRCHATRRIFSGSVPKRLTQRGCDANLEF